MASNNEWLLPAASPEKNKLSPEDEVVKQAIETAFIRIQNQLREQGYGELLEYLAGPTNLDTLNISSSGFFLLINGMINNITAQIWEIEFHQRYKPNEPFPQELPLKIAINWLGIQAALDPNVVDHKIANFLREKKGIIENCWSEISGHLSQISKQKKGVNITTIKKPEDSQTDNQKNNNFILTFNPTTNDNQATPTITIVLSPPSLPENPRSHSPLSLLEQLWAKLKNLKARFSNS